MPHLVISCDYLILGAKISFVRVLPSIVWGIVSNAREAGSAVP